MNGCDLDFHQFAQLSKSALNKQILPTPFLANNYKRISMSDPRLQHLKILLVTDGHYYRWFIKIIECINRAGQVNVFGSFLVHV